MTGRHMPARRLIENRYREPRAKNASARQYCLFGNGSRAPFVRGFCRCLVDWKGDGFQIFWEISRLLSTYVLHAKAAVYGELYFADWSAAGSARV
jgi:hypothetical protein